MPRGDKSKKECFEMWKSGLRLSEIQNKTTALPNTVKGWVLAWERGAQKQWDANIHE